MPSFWLALLLILLFAVTLGWLPASGVARSAPRASSTGCAHLVLPVATLTLLTVGGIAPLHPRRDDRGAAPGLHPHRARQGPERRAAWWSATPCATRMIPVVTIVALNFGALFSGALIVETMFAYLGMGKLIYDAVIGNDFNLALAALLFATLLTLLANLGADVAYAWLDPRISYAD